MSGRLQIITGGVLLATLTVAACTSARAFEPFGWLEGVVSPRADAVTATLMYSVAFRFADTSDGLEQELKSRSELVSKSDEGAADRAVLLARARSDEARFRALLQDRGYFAADIGVRIDGEPLDAIYAGAERPAPERSAEVEIEIDQGPLFRLGDLSFRTTRDASPTVPRDPAAYGVVPGEIARVSVIAKALARYVEEWRIAGYPLARIFHKRIVADHATNLVSVDVLVDPGEEAVVGWVTVTGTETLNADFVGRYSGLRSGERYSPQDVASARERLRKLDAIESVRIEEEDRLDGQDGLPVNIRVTPQRPRFVGALASVSTIDGGAMQAYWGHRNLFGQAERFRIEGGVSQIGAEAEDFQYFATASLTKPGVLDIDTDFFVDIAAARERPETYESNTVGLSAGLQRRFSEERNGRLAFRTEYSSEDSALGSETYAVLALPVEVTEDRRNDRLDPTEGWRGSISFEPAYEALNHGAFVTAGIRGSTYLALNPGGTLVIATHGTAAGTLADDVLDVPASWRFFAGGGGSVRGHRFRSLGPLAGDDVIGGLSLLEASLEMRWRVTPKIGLVPFIDAASVSPEVWPTFENIYAGAGIGLRYYTAIGPLRLDVAAPFGEEASRGDVAVYVGLGQSF